MENCNILDDIFANDELGVLDTPTKGNILKVREELRHKKTTKPDYVARRRPCVDFEVFKPMLDLCKQEIKACKRAIIPFKNEQRIDKGLFFVLNGILLYVAEKGAILNINGKKKCPLTLYF